MGVGVDAEGSEAARDRAGQVEEARGRHLPLISLLLILLYILFLFLLLEI